jgi:hypothetical protein
MMYLHRRFSLPVHGLVEFAAGVAMMLAPAGLGFSAAAFVVSAALGSILAGMALDVSSGPSRTLAWHGHFDSLFMIATALAALGFAAADQAAAAIFLAAIVALQAALSTLTRYAGTA